MNNNRLVLFYIYSTATSEQIEGLKKEILTIVSSLQGTLVSFKYWESLEKEERVIHEGQFKIADKKLFIDRLKALKQEKFDKVLDHFVFINS